MTPYGQSTTGQSNTQTYTPTDSAALAGSGMGMLGSISPASPIDASRRTSSESAKARPDCRSTISTGRANPRRSEDPRPDGAGHRKADAIRGRGSSGHRRQARGSRRVRRALASDADRRLGRAAHALADIEGAASTAHQAASNSRGARWKTITPTFNRSKPVRRGISKLQDAAAAKGRQGALHFRRAIPDDQEAAIRKRPGGAAASAVALSTAAGPLAAKPRNKDARAAMRRRS